MRNDLQGVLEKAKDRKELPAVMAYNRIDGPGSSLDLREFQQSLWRIPVIPEDPQADPTMEWTRDLPRTVGITIDTGTNIQAEPFKRGRIGVRSVEYGTEVTSAPGDVLPTKENWLLKIAELFGLSGVMFSLHNLHPGIQSSGLGGSATATTGLCILANELAGRPLSGVQLVSMASRVEQDFGVSITGTQEQSNVVYGGVTDYVWFPWGIPGNADSGFGTSIRRQLMDPAGYEELEQRMAIFHSGKTRASTDVNAVWMRALTSHEGYRQHQRKLDIAYRFREGLRLRQWDDVMESIDEYRQVRTAICPAYMDGAKEIQGFANAKDCVAFPLGAGGGGGILVFAREPASLQSLRREIGTVYREIPFKIKDRGHDLVNLPLEKEV
ncbi:MAG: GHMP kinase [Planctomycetes bacterium]|nr:GHMP kinase [Planctomycetota bacterium]